jgi:hypothetical protein
MLGLAPGRGRGGREPCHHQIMSDIERRGGSRPSRKKREQRAYRLVLATGTFGVLGVAGILLAIVTSFGAGWPIVSLIIAAICFMLLRRTVR